LEKLLAEENAPTPGGSPFPTGPPTGLPTFNGPNPTTFPGFVPPAIIPIVGVVEGTAAASAAGAWGTFLDETEGLAEINTSLDAIAGSAIAAGTGITIAEVGGGIIGVIADLPEIAVAAGMVIVVYITGKILIFVGQHFPNPNILGWHPLNFLRSGFEKVGQALIDAADLIIHPIENLFLTPIHMFKALFQRGANATASAHNKVATLHNETIPAAQLKAEQLAANYTDTSVAQLNTDLQSRIANAQQRITDLQTGLNLAITTGATAVFANLDQQLLTRLQGDENILSAITTEIQTQLPLEIATAVSDAQATEQQALTAATNGLQGQITTLQGQLTSAQTALAGAETTITNAQTQLATLDTDDANNATAIKALQTTITTATDDYNNLVVTIDNLNNQITGISNTLGTVQATQQLTTANYNGISALGATGLVAVVAAIATKLTNIQTQIDTCLVDNCDQTKPNNIHNVLKDILGAITAAGELAFIAEAVKDPIGTAESFAPEVDAITSGAVDTLNALLSL
jgi:predicted  nucleic acid-binding Zn-ribbon protein